MGSLCKIFDRRATATSGGNPQNPQYWLQKLFGAGETYSGVEIDEDKALTFSAVWNAVNIIAGAVGFLPMNLYERSADGESKKVLSKHPVHKLLHDRPNEYMDAMVFREAVQAHVLLWGNGYIEIERRNNGQPMALWLLLPNRMKPEIKDGKLTYKYQVESGVPVPISPENVLHIRGLGFNGIRGYDVITYAANSIGAGMAVEKFGAKYFGNNANPAGVLEHPESLGDKAYERLSEKWAELHQGLDNAHRVAILEEGMKWHEVGMSPEASQFLDTRKFSVTEVARWFNIPPHMLKDLDRATFSNIEHQGIEFVTWTLLGWMKRWELEATYKLLPSADRGRLFAKFNANALLRGDTKARFEAYRIGRLGGWMSINDVRRLEDMNPIEDGDNYLEPLNMKPVGEPFPDKAKGTEPKVNSLVFREMVETMWMRILTKETNAMRKAAKKPDEFKSRMERYYTEHQEYILRMIRPLERLTEKNLGVASQVDKYISSHRSHLRGLGNVDELEQVLGQWQSEEPLRLTDNIMKGLHNGEN